ncbi:hypothetical protein A3N65_08175 [Klebsiella aerogenes]|nr:hypothetical protein A3N65_08175 [Klebsiella aerogenes]
MNKTARAQTCTIFRILQSFLRTILNKNKNGLLKTEYIRDRAEMKGHEQNEYIDRSSLLKRPVNINLVTSINQVKQVL